MEIPTRTCKKCHTVKPINFFKKKLRICVTCKQNIRVTELETHKADSSPRVCEVCEKSVPVHDYYLHSRKCKTCSHQLDSKSKRQDCDKPKEKTCEKCGETKKSRLFIYKRSICRGCYPSKQTL